MSDRRQAAVLLVALVGSFVVGGAIASPFDIDVGAGHTVFHFLVAAGIGAAAAYVFPVPAGSAPVNFARGAAVVLAAAQLVEAMAAIPDPEGNGTFHGVPNILSQLLLPVFLLSLLLALVRGILRRPAPQ